MAAALKASFLGLLGLILRNYFDFLRTKLLEKSHIELGLIRPMFYVFLQVVDNTKRKLCCTNYFIRS